MDTETMPLPVESADHDQVVVLTSVSWQQYEALLAATADERPGLRMHYLKGSLQIMSPSSLHEHWKKLLARLIEAFAEERDVTLVALGSTTYKDKLEEVGAEPDECYHLGDEKDRPDIAIEVVRSGRSIDKLAVYRRLRVREVWFWVDRKLRVFRLGRSGYVERSRSEVLPELDIAAVSKLVASTPPARQTEAVRRFRRGLQSPRRG